MSGNGGSRTVTLSEDEIAKNVEMCDIDIASTLEMGIKDNDEELFEKATEFVRGIAGTANSDDLLYFYARYKVATVGPCDVPKPSFYQLTAKSKWQAWKDIGDMCKEDAIMQYIDRLSEIEPEWEGKEAKDPTSGWISVSCPTTTEAEVLEGDKTAFDWVKEGDGERLFKCVKEDSKVLQEKDEDGLSLLHWACDRGNGEIAGWLIEQTNTLINAQDNDGQTPLHYACCCGHEEIVKLLLDANADSTISDNDGVLPNNSDTEENIKKIFS